MTTRTVEIETLPFNKASINRLSGYYIDYPVVYFLNNETTVYIGEKVLELEKKKFPGQD